MASRAGNSPTLKNITTGMRNTNCGMVCRVSLIGRRKAETRPLRADQMPSATPMPAEMNTEMAQR